MPTPLIVFVKEPPTASAFAAIRESVGWINPALDILQSSINSSLFWISAYSNDKLIATGRVIGDGVMYFYVQDIIVHPEHQNLGLGSQIMQSINTFLAVSCSPGSTVGLLAAQGKEGFYEKFGFVPRDGQQLGLGMCRFI